MTADSPQVILEGRGPSSTVRPAGPLSRRTVWLYGIGQAAEGVKNYSFTTFLLFYYTSVLGLSGSLAGAALMIALVFDAVTDPVVAVISDRTRSRWGRRHPYLVLSAVPLGFFFYLAFSPPAALRVETGDSPWALFGWLLAFSVLTRAAMTLFHVPHMALGAELTDDFDERTRVVAARSLSAVVATAFSVTFYFVLVGAMETPAYPDGRLNPVPYTVFAGTFGIFIATAVLASAWGTRDRIPFLGTPDEQSEQRSLAEAIVGDTTAALRIPSFRSLFVGFTFCFLAWGVTNALGTHNALYFWHVTIEQQGLWGLFTLVGLIVGMGYWRRVAARTDKKPTFLRGLACFTVFAAAPPLLKVVGLFPAEGSPLYVPLFVLSGFGLAFGIASAMVLVGSMMADITDEDELLHSRRREAIFFGALAFAGKAASGFGTVAAGVIYDWVGLYRGLDPSAAPPEVSTRLGIITGAIILVLVGLSLGVFQRYDLTRERHAEIRRRLDEREAPGELA